MKRSLILTVLSFLVLAQLGLAQVPQTISYQGVLKDDSGNLLDGYYDLTFNLYDDTETVVWSEGVKLVPVSQGVFSVVLGKAPPPAEPLPDPFPSPAWLGISVAGGAELEPRIELTAVPYALQAGELNMPATERYYSISPAAFNPSDNSTGFIRSYETIYSTMATGDVYFYAPANLPHGAVIKEMVAAFIYNEATQPIVFDLYRMSLNSTDSDIIARCVSSSSSTAIQTVTESATTTVATVDNSSYTYVIHTYWPAPTTATDITVRSVKIVYEVTTPLP